MGLKDNVTKKLWQATSDKTELNKQVLRMKRSFDDVNKMLSKNNKKKSEKKE